MELLLTVEQAAERLQLAPFTVRKHLREGRLRGIKRGAKAWRIPESALLESSHAAPARGEESEAARLWARLADFETHNAALAEVAAAPASVQAIIDQKSAQVAADWYATPEGEAELRDWRALDGEPFQFAGEEIGE